MTTPELEAAAARAAEAAQAAGLPDPATRTNTAEAAAILAAGAQLAMLATLNVAAVALADQLEAIRSGGVKSLLGFGR